jgi:hypothetical protein
LDLTGGWYDAGDHVKFNFPMAWSATTLIWGVLEFGDAWSRSGEMANILDTVKWPLDYLLKCHPDENTYYVQVGDGGADHQFWGAAESMNMNRPSFAVTPQNPGTEFAAEGAAALAAGSILFKDDKAYSELLKAKAKSLFELADKYRGSSDISAPFYKSYRYGREGGVREGGEEGWFVLCLFICVIRMGFSLFSSRCTICFSSYFILSQHHHSLTSALLLSHPHTHTKPNQTAATGTSSVGPPSGSTRPPRNKNTSTWPRMTTMTPAAL